jgi:hypothetical protein
MKITATADASFGLIVISRRTHDAGKNRLVRQTNAPGTRRPLTSSTNADSLSH